MRRKETSETRADWYKRRPLTLQPNDLRQSRKKWTTPAGDTLTELDAARNQGNSSACAAGRQIGTWWSWAISLVIYVPGMLMGAAIAGGIQRKQKQTSGGKSGAGSGAAFFTGLIATAAGYLLFWGLPASKPPSGVFSAASGLLAGVIAAGAAAQDAA